MKIVRRYAIGILLAVVGLGFIAGPASAHTGFESSDPTNGAVLSEPVEIITLAFSGPAEPTGERFQVLDPAGVLREPIAATTVDGSTWTLRFEPPIAGGVAGVRWTVKAPDAHAINGSFSFTVPAAPPAEVAPALPTATEDDVRDPAEQPLAVEAQTQTIDLDSFLDTASDATATPRRLGALGRMVTLSGTLLGVGALVFAAAVLRAARRDVRHVLYWVRRGGLLVVIGAVVELVAQLAIEAGGSWSQAVTPSAVAAVLVSPFGLAVILRLVGGAALSSGARLDIAEASGARDPVVALKELVGAGAGPPVDFWGGQFGGSGAANAATAEPYVHDGDHAWLPKLGSSGAYIGAATVLAAHLFDGHTVTKGDRFLTAIVDVVHVAGGAIWVGGVLMLASILWRRHREGRELRALQLAVRFSVVATIALVAVGVAGLALTVIILDTPSELWTTEWGRLLMVKILFVAIAACTGFYNHKVLIPEMIASGDTRLDGHFRTVVTAEAVALVVVLVVTALLMGAAS